MRYLLYLPNPETVTYAECETADRFMNYLKAKGITEVESEPARFNLYQAPDNCRKYRLKLPDTAGIEEIRQLWEQVQEAGQVWLGRNPAGFEYKENDTDFVSELLAA